MQGENRQAHPIYLRTPASFLRLSFTLLLAPLSYISCLCLYVRSPCPDSVLSIGWCCFQSPNSGSPDTRLWPIFRIIYFGPLMAVVPPSLPSPEIPLPELHVFRHFARSCISLSASCLLSARFCLCVVPPQERRLSPAVRLN